MTNDTRVMLKPKFQEHYGMLWPIVGTVRRKSPYGYITVIWDDGTKAHFAPGSASVQLDIVSGQDAIKRHEWDCRVPNEEKCRTCGVAQTVDNYKGPCTA